MRANPSLRACCVLVLYLLACGDDAMSDTTLQDDNTEHDAAAPTAGKGGQTPPMGAAALMPWLESGAYLDWTCEPESHPARAPSPHGYNRICSNAAISENAQGSADWPMGAAAVKELFANAQATTPVGYAVYLKTADDSQAGDNWYWYEVVPGDHPAPHDENGVVADGMGDDEPAKAICVSCHAAAGSDDAHTPSEGGRDQVYTPVR